MKTCWLLLIGVLAAGCAERADATISSTSADNTKKNERDRSGDTVTPPDQKENEADRKITQAVRQSVMDMKDLSIKGQNVKIVTQDGVVTLRGPVDSDAEKQNIAASAQKIEGVKRVDNQLEVASK